MKVTFISMSSEGDICFQVLGVPIEQKQGLQEINM